MTTKTEIQVTLTLIFSSTPGNRKPYRNYYECTGPDGRKFTNTSKTELARALRKYYGPVVLKITDLRSPVW